VIGDEECVVIDWSGSRHGPRSHCAAAQPEEFLASEPTRALCTGSGMRFEDRGEYALKGLDEPRLLYRYDGAP
jgi:class 3 adenylate cyclase